jgi:phage terminase large subunit-like protein
VLAVHPWHGEDVAVLQNYGDRAVVVERENGDRRIIPVSWTSLVPVVRCRLSDGRMIRISPQAAFDLSRWVSSRLDGKHGGEA